MNVLVLYLAVSSALIVFCFGWVVTLYFVVCRNLRGRLDIQASSIENLISADVRSAEEYDKLERLMQVYILKQDLLVDDMGLEFIEHPAQPERTVVHPAKPAMWELRRK